MDTDPAKIRGGVTASCGAMGSLAYGRGCAKLARGVHACSLSEKIKKWSLKKVRRSRASGWSLLTRFGASRVAYPFLVYMLSPLPRRRGWAYSSLWFTQPYQPSRKRCCVGPRIVLFEGCSAFTRVTACTLALSPIRDTLIEGFSHFITSMTAPIASGWRGCRVGLTPTGKRRLCTAHTHRGHQTFPASEVDFALLLTRSMLAR
jgi:hypothetical protein